MRSILLCCCTALLGCFTPAAAQTDAPEKETVLIDLFVRNPTVPAPYAQTLRAYVSKAFIERGRHRVLNAENLFAAPAPGYEIAPPDRIAERMSALLELRAPLSIEAGARYLVCGTIAAYRFEHVDLPSDDKKKPSRPGFRATFDVVLSAVDLKLGERLPDETFRLTASAPVALDADRAALARICPQLEYYIDRHYKFETTILDLCPPDKKGRVRDLYIHSGTRMGVKQGDLFLVYEEVPVGGVFTRQKVGRLRVTDASNPDAARCRMAKGDAEIAEALRAGRPLVCISDGKAFGY